MYKNQETPVHIAATFGHENLIQLLLDGGANVNAIDKDQDTHLHNAALFGYKNVIRVLLDSGAVSSAVDSFRQTAKDCAASKGHSAIVRLFEDWEKNQKIRAGIGEWGGIFQKIIVKELGGDMMGDRVVGGGATWGFGRGEFQGGVLWIC